MVDGRVATASADVYARGGGGADHVSGDAGSFWKEGASHESAIWAYHPGTHQHFRFSLPLLRRHPDAFGGCHRHFLGGAAFCTTKF